MSIFHYIITILRFSSIHFNIWLRIFHIRWWHELLIIWWVWWDLIWSKLLFSGLLLKLLSIINFNIGNNIGIIPFLSHTCFTVVLHILSSFITWFSEIFGTPLGETVIHLFGHLPEMIFDLHIAIIPLFFQHPPNLIFMW